ncbi:MAG TPA: hypoxanthine phosphoribosyltransferase [Candidatus Marinimicrobia bacterium]|jgi:hypoxanthine phosphoribosyltransferase|nr:hypoxanthine phosphoribosyltransferase [Candidatus Neomarinimicrobiota bacterium]HIN19414.1 hypoxanthine phosphoribosyltransferase [Candidatus Neomarinimicrobiota bacterium]
MHFHGYELSLVISDKDIQNRINEIGRELSVKFKDEVPIFIGILNGSFIFMADLIRALDIDCEMDFIKLASYKGSQSTGTVRLLKDISAEITNRHIVIVEDIIDSGLTIKFIKDRMQDASPASLTIVTLLLKPDVANLEFPIDVIGFEIAPEFVVGYGLDYDQKMRHLPAIYRIEKD